LKFEKKDLAILERCYAVSNFKVHNNDRLFFATEGRGKCISYTLPELCEEIVWEGPGGTMSMVPVPGKDGDFLAVQKFFPTFDSKEAEIVYVTHSESGYSVKKLFNLPYVHRFDVFSVAGKNYFVGATLCSSKTHKEDWSDPGKIYVGCLSEDLERPVHLRVIHEGLTKNHGYTKTEIGGKSCGVFTCEQGVFVLAPPEQEDGDWKITELMKRQVSDIAFVDIDGDGEDEIVTIEPFHGNQFLIYKKYGGTYKVVYAYPKKMNFGHVVWGGKLCGKNVIIGGYRREGRELFLVTCDDAKNMVFHTQTIDWDIGPSNISVLHGEKQDLLLSANREIGQAAIYIVTE